MSFVSRRLSSADGCRVADFKPSYVVLLFALGRKFQTAASHKQCKHKYQAARIYVEVETLHFAAAAAQKQYDEQNPSAIATAAKATVVAAASATAVVKQTVEHSVPPFRRVFSAFVLTVFSLLYTMYCLKKVLHAAG